MCRRPSGGRRAPVLLGDPHRGAHTSSVRPRDRARREHGEEITSSRLYLFQLIARGTGGGRGEGGLRGDSRRSATMTTRVRASEVSTPRYHLPGLGVYRASRPGALVAQWHSGKSVRRACVAWESGGEASRVCKRWVAFPSAAARLCGRRSRQCGSTVGKRRFRCEPSHRRSRHRH